MTDYHPLIARAIAGLETNTGEARRALYERARGALVAQLRSVTPALSESDITRERLALEEAIRKIEGEQLRASRLARAPAVKSLRPEPPPEPSPPPAAPAEEQPAQAAPQPEPAATAAPERFDEAPAEMGHSEPRASSEAPAEACDADRDGLKPPVAAPPADAAVKPRAWGRGPDDATEMPPREEPPREKPRARAAAREIPAFSILPGPPPRDSHDSARLARELDDLAAQYARVTRERQSAQDANDAPAAAPALPPHAEGLERTPPSDRAPERHPHESAPEAEPDGVDEAPPPLVVRRSGLAVRIAIAVVVLGVLAALSAVLYRQRDNLAELYALFRSPPTQVARESAPARPKIEDRIGPGQPDPARTATRLGQPATQPPAAVAQRVVLYEEDPKDPEGKQYFGSVIWRTETVSPGPGLAPELAVKATIEVPDRRVNMSFTMVRNTDTTLPASHTVDIRFNLPPDFVGGGIASVPGVLMKQTEQARGVPLAGLAVKVTDNVFLIGLSAVEADVQRNAQLLKERTWFDVPIVYSTGSRAILAMEKGTPGERAFNEAFTAWGRTGTAAR